MNRNTVPHTKAHKPPFTQAHQKPHRSQELLNMQETEHSTGDNKPEGNEVEHVTEASIDISDPPDTRDVPVIGTDGMKGSTGSSPTHDEIQEKKERGRTLVTTIKMTDLPRRKPNPLQPLMNSNPRQPEAN